jgi:hypothetical protein
VALGRQKYPAVRASAQERPKFSIWANLAPRIRPLLEGPAAWKKHIFTKILAEVKNQMEFFYVGRAHFIFCP